MASAIIGAAQPPVQRQQRMFLHASEHATLDPKNVLALRTLFAVAHRLALLLGESWLLVLGTVNCLDCILSTPRQAAQVLPLFGRNTPAATECWLDNVLGHTSFYRVDATNAAVSLRCIVCFCAHRCFRCALPRDRTQRGGTMCR